MKSKLLLFLLGLIAMINIAAAQAALKTATFAGGCFWCMEKPFEQLAGVKSVISGYAGGVIPHPTYEQVSSENTKYVEAVQITYDPTLISYERLLNVYWRQIDPMDAGGQFVDRGPSYRSIIFYHDNEQKNLAEISKEELGKSGIFSKPVATEIKKFTTFYPAETYHQDYYKKNPIRYHYYRYRSGRDQFLKKIWKNKSFTTKLNNPKDYQVPSKADLKEILTPIQYKVTQEDGTEPAYKNAYWNNKEPGIYVDVVSGEPLFSSLDKYDSKTGWPSFTKPIEPNDIVEKVDSHFFIKRTEIRSKHADSHLGHVFNDGPPPTGLRYCMNSAALRFIPVKDLEKEGYVKYVSLFKGMIDESKK